jgi:hypothetical protein
MKTSVGNGFGGSGDIAVGQIGDDAPDDPAAGRRKGALVDDLVGAYLPTCPLPRLGVFI